MCNANSVGVLNSMNLVMRYYLIHVSKQTVIILWLLENDEISRNEKEYVYV